MTETANENTEDYAKHFSEESFWKKVKKYASKAGKEALEKVLILYYCLADPETPAWAKTIIIAALGYFILPIDAVPDFIPVVGIADDAAVIGFAILTVAAYIKREHSEKAKEKIEDFFGK
jgi:uncharacterized membrane protein YkvA (DUF1232 family)